MKEEFRFERVYVHSTLKIVFTLIIVGLSFAAPYMIGMVFSVKLYWIFNLRLWAAIVIFTYAAYVLKFWNQTITISFDDTKIYFKFDLQQQRYLKEEVKGFYSIDYNNVKQSGTDFSFYFKNGKKIKFADVDYRPAKFSEEKHQMFKRFLRTAQQELGYQPSSKNRSWIDKRKNRVWFSDAA